VEVAKAISGRIRRVNLFTHENSCEPSDLVDETPEPQRVSAGASYGAADSCEHWRIAVVLGQSGAYDAMTSPSKTLCATASRATVRGSWASALVRGLHSKSPSGWPGSDSDEGRIIPLGGAVTMLFAS
jgi:hypothetical protein